MITYESEDLQTLDLSMIDGMLLAELGDSADSFSLYLVCGYENEMPTKSSLQIAHDSWSGRTGIVLIEGAVVHHTTWMNASSPDDALELYSGNGTATQPRERAAERQPSAAEALL